MKKDIKETRLAVAAIISHLLEAEEAIEKGLFANEREALLEAHRIIAQARKTAYEAVTVEDIAEWTAIKEAIE